ncbi:MULTISPECIES: PilZ domain-containing protein [Kordiimonas]|uniref:PilZ domain-containing protein n=1 Tax=Kordiimonas lacus TaxID=637679 RepID=A0A1G6TVI9_9PROT|nr:MULTISPECIES: PilZ domain-containing protein [Kordiimonas]SDD32325.1 PilZ domain-containing protein [Kordiimonas lacus]
MAKETVKKKAAAEKAKAEEADSRRFKRRSVLWPAKIRVGKHELSCQIWNLSLGGARVRVDLPLQDGVKIELVLTGRGEIPATVAWAKGELLGVAFDVGPEVVKRMFEDRLHVLGLSEDD